MEAREFISLSFSARKRALFPVDNRKSTNNDEELLDDIVPMGSLSSASSSPDRYSSPAHSPRWDITPVKHKNSPALVTPQHGPSTIMRSPVNKIVNESPQRKRLIFMDSIKKGLAETPKRVQNPPFTDIGDEIIAETPEKSVDHDGIISPLKGLVKSIVIEETPDSSFSMKSNISSVKISKRRFEEPVSPKTDGKSSFDFNSSAARLIQNSFYKPQLSKVKAALFPERNVGIKRPQTAVEEPRPRARLKVTHPGSRSQHSHHSHKRRRAAGEINCGVYHRVKKPKAKKRPSGEIVKAAAEAPKILPVDRLNDDVQKCQGVDSPMVDGAPEKKQRLSEKSSGENLNYFENIVPQSPECEMEPDPSKKFFKTNRTVTHHATITVADNVKIQVKKGKLALEGSTKKPKQQKQICLSPEEIIKDFEEETLEKCSDSVMETVEEVLKKLEEDEEDDASSHIQTITSSTSCLAIEDEMHVVGGGEVVTTNSVSAAEPSEAEEGKENNKKYFPVFYKEVARADAPVNSPKRGTPSSKKWRPIGEDQYQIDAGQVNLRLDQCRECGVLYNKGDPEDEISHLYIHNNVRALKFTGWKNERVIKMYPEGKVIVIYPDDQKAWVKKAKEVLDVVDRELGYVEGFSQTLEQSKVYLYISKNRVIGALAAHPRTEAYRMLSLGVEGPDCCSEESYPVKCGVSRLWTVFDHRRKGVASRLMDCLRVSFMFDHFLSLEEIAFSTPTENGKVFAEKYLRTPQFMVFY